MNHDHRPTTNTNLDPSLRAIEQALDTLGAEERARAHGALEQDILRATRSIRSDALRRPPSFFARIAPMARFGAAAAIVAIMATVAFVGIRSGRSASHQFAQVEKDLDAFLTAGDTGPGETGDTTLVLGDAALVDIKASIAAAEESLDDFWAVPDDTTDPLGSDLETSL